MSILFVKDLSYGFGDWVIFNNVFFCLLKGEYVGLIGVNGEGKLIFMNIIIGKFEFDEGKVEWLKNVCVGYLDQYIVLEKGKFICDVLKDVFYYLFVMEEEMNEIYNKMGEVDFDEFEKLFEEVGVI